MLVEGQLLDRQQLFWDFKWKKFNQEIEETEIAFGELLQRWEIAGDDFLLSGLTGREFLSIRETGLKSLMALEGIDLQFGLGEAIARTYGGKAVQFRIWLIEKGVVVQKELDFLSERYGGGFFDFESMGLIDEALLDAMQPSSGEGNIMSLDESIREMEELRGRGHRIVIALGSFDVGTEGQSRVFKEFRWFAQEFGSIFALVSGDREVSLVKGGHRPYSRVRDRMEFVASCDGVSSVAPLEFSGAHSLVDLTKAYEYLHKSLSGVAHIRVIGEKDDWYSQYLKQCQSAGIILLCSGLPRITSATEMGSRLRTVIS